MGVTDVLFCILAFFAGMLLSLNVLLIILKLTHRRGLALRLGAIADPYLSYLRLGGVGGSKHA